MKKNQKSESKIEDNWEEIGARCCGSCMYYVNYRCRRRAPRGNEGWTAVFRTDWCGEHKLSKEIMSEIER